MLRKLTNGTRILDEKMKKHIFGGKDCSKQCLDDCGGQNNQLERELLNGDAEGSKVVPIE